MKREQGRSANLIREDSYLPIVMVMPNAMSLEWGYEEHRDLVTSMTYKRGTTVVAERGYVYDVLERPVSRQTTRQGNTVNDTFTYNSRSELIGATVSGKAYSYRPTAPQCRTGCLKASWYCSFFLFFLSLFESF